MLSKVFSFDKKTLNKPWPWPYWNYILVEEYLPKSMEAMEILTSEVTRKSYYGKYIECKCLTPSKKSYRCFKEVTVGYQNRTQGIFQTITAKFPNAFIYTRKYFELNRSFYWIVSGTLLSKLWYHMFSKCAVYCVITVLTTFQTIIAHILTKYCAVCQW